MTPPDYKSADDPLVGRTIGEKFKLRKCVGIGSSGSVYQADQVALGRTVAVKVLRPELAVDERIVKRFHDEALAASRLNHPNTVSVIDYGQTPDGLLYIVMEFLRGETLTRLIADSPPLEARRITDLLSQVLAGLEEAHAAGVVHADLKADNVVVEQRRGGWELAKVVDFGISRLVGAPKDPRADKTVCGTPEYMAPEMITGTDPTVASDIYAAGVLLYEMLVGKTPFAGAGSSLDVLTRHLREPPTPPSQKAPDRDISPVLEEAAMRALSKSPADRFDTVEAFRRAIAAASGRERAHAADAQLLCTACGVHMAQSFKFCPECGHPTSEPRSVTRDLSTRLTAAMLGDRDLGDVERILNPAEVAIADTMQLTDADVDVAIAREKTEDDATPPGIFPLPLVGRARERELLLDFATMRSAPQMALLAGGPGSGRSRLVREVCAEAAHAGARIYLAGPDPSGLGSPYYPVRSMVAAVLDLPPICPYDGLGDAIERLGVTRRDLPGVAELFGHPTALCQLEPAVRRRELLAATVRVLRAACAVQPSVLVFEDADAYDAPSTELLHRLAAIPDETDLRVLITCGEELAERWHAVDQFVLESLSDDAFDELAAHLARCDNAALPDAETLRRHTNGSPTHVAQLVRYLIEGGNLPAEPLSVGDLVGARIDLLPATATAALQAAASLGRECAVDRVRAALPNVDDLELDDALSLLDARDLILLDEDVVWFHQALIRDIVYESTPAVVRRELHASHAEGLQTSVADAATLGHHFERAGDLERAAELLALGGDEAVRHLDDAGACRLYNRALGCARSLMLLAGDDGDARRRFVEISIKLGDALRIGGQLGLARGLLEEARTHAYGEPLLEAQLLRACGHLYMSENDIDAAIALLRDGIGLGITTGNTELLAELYLDLSTMYLRNGEPVGAATELEEAVNLLTVGEGPRATGAPASMWHILLRLAHLYSSLDRMQDAIRTGEDALAQARSHHTAVGSARALALLAELYEAKKDFGKAAQYRERAVDEMRRLGDRRGTAELLLAGAAPTRSLVRIKPHSLREARDLAQEIGWREGFEKAQETLN